MFSTASRFLMLFIPRALICSRDGPGDALAAPRAWDDRRPPAWRRARSWRSPSLTSPRRRPRAPPAPQPGASWAGGVLGDVRVLGPGLEHQLRLQTLRSRRRRLPAKPEMWSRWRWVTTTTSSDPPQSSSILWATSRRSRGLARLVSLRAGSRRLWHRGGAEVDQHVPPAVVGVGDAQQDAVAEPDVVGDQRSLRSVRCRSSPHLPVGQSLPRARVRCMDDSPLRRVAPGRKAPDAHM